MVPKVVLGVFGAAVALAAASCTVSKSSNPLSPTVAGPIPGVNISTPTTVQPPTGAQIAVDQQPVTLTTRNASTNGVRPLSYLFEVATDTGFANKVFTRDGVTAGDALTSVRLPDALATGHSYFWHVRAQDGANTGSFSSTVSFNVYTPIVIQPPTPISPIANAVTSSLRPKFTFANAQRSGPIGSVSYTAEVADSNAFVNRIAVLTVGEQSGQTSVDATSDLPAGAQLFWRVRAFDPTTTGPWSGTQAFQTPAPGGGGGGTGDPNDGLNVTLATFVDNPPDVGGFRVTAKMTLIQFRTDALIVDFDKRTGAGRWPNRPFNPGDPPDPRGGGIQYTLGLCFNLGGWYCSAAIQFWQDRELEAGAAPSSIPQTWYYDARWAPMNGYLPATGEQVGVFVVAGNVRGVRSSGLLSTRERSNIAVVPFDRGNGSRFTLLNGISFRIRR